jgi:hypothetical protein
LRRLLKRINDIVFRPAHGANDLNASDDDARHAQFQLPIECQLWT